jgi:hypothetical protein
MANRMTITFHYVDTISNIFFSNDSSNLSLQNCRFQSSPLYIFNTNNINLLKGVENFGTPFRIHQDPQDPLFPPCVSLHISYCFIEKGVEVEAVLCTTDGSSELLITISPRDK